MPTLPKFTNTTTNIGIIKVLGNIDAKEQGYPKRNTGVAGKVEVDLERVGKNAQPGSATGARERGEDLIGKGSQLISKE